MTRGSVRGYQHGGSRPVLETSISSGDSYLRSIAFLICIVPLAANGCQEPVGADTLPPPTFIVSPSTVAPGDSFAVVFTLRNPTGQSVTITSGAGCLFFLGAVRGSEPVSVQGLTYYCTASITTFQIPPHDSLRAVRRAVAAERGGTGIGTPLRAGTYRIQTMMNTTALPDVEAPLTVSEPSGAT